MKSPIVLIGIGEMGAVFARGLLRIGYPVVPVTRTTDIDRQAQEWPHPEMVLIAVAEKDVQSALSSLPDAWRDRVALLQNELLPRDWQAHALKHPTIISVWFEKKKGQDVKVLIPSPVHGPKAGILKQALDALDIPCRRLESEQELLHELILKNVYILTTNIAGLVTGGSVSELWSHHESLAREVADEIMDIQEWLTGVTLNREGMIRDMLVAFAGDPDHQCMGRSAPARLQRALEIADKAGLAVRKIREIQSGLS